MGRSSQMTCTVCREVLTNYSTYSRHLHIHPTCSICNVKVKDDADLSKHNLKHPLCLMCGDLLKSHSAAMQHYSTHDQARCFLCYDVFEDLDTLVIHYKQEHGPCQFCGDSLADKESLDRHISLVHSGQKKKRTSPNK